MAKLADVRRQRRLNTQDDCAAPSKGMGCCGNILQEYHKLRVDIENIKARLDKEDQKKGASQYDYGAALEALKAKKCNF